MNSASSNQSRNRRSLFVPILIAIVAVALIIFSLTGNGDDPKPEATPSPTQSAEQDPGDEDFAPTQQEPSQEEIDEMVAELAQFARHDKDDPLALGEADAPVTMIVYSDFQCPYCGQWARETLPVLIEKYVDDGQVRVEWHDMPVLGDASVAAARAARAAANQDMFWAFADVLYDADWQSAATDADYEPEAMADLAAELGMDRDQFIADIEDSAHNEQIEAERNQAWGIGFTGTPAFLVEGLPVMGAQPLETFENAINLRLEELGVQ